MIKIIKILLKKVLEILITNEIKINILKILARSENEISGLEMIKQYANKVEVGTIYCYLKELEEKGLVSCRTESIDPQALSMKFYLITDKGRGLIANI